MEERMLKNQKVVVLCMAMIIANAYTTGVIFDVDGGGRLH
jgi:hypothetical protein